MRLFLDASILFTAAHNPHGKAAFLVEAGDAGHWELVTSFHAREEAHRNLARKYPECLDDFEALLSGVHIVGHPPDLPVPPGLVDKDRPIFRAALASEATHLLTGDLRHFGPFMNQPNRTLGVLIQTVAAFLAALSSRGGSGGRA